MTDKPKSYSLKASLQPTSPAGPPMTDADVRAFMDAARAERLVGERTPDGRFRKGVSGNLLGRPRSKHQRAASSRQYRRDILEITEELVPVKIGGRVQMVPFHKANLMSMRAKAGAGHGPSQRHIDKLHREALVAHEEANPLLTELLEDSEARAVNSGVDALPGWAWRDLNRLRKLSWRL